SRSSRKVLLRPNCVFAMRAIRDLVRARFSAIKDQRVARQRLKGFLLENPTQLMSFLGLTPSEDSTGPRRRQGSITKSGNEAVRRALVEAAHQYRCAPRISPPLQKRQHGQSQAVRAIAWKAQVRLCGRFRTRQSHRKKSQ